MEFKWSEKCNVFAGSLIYLYILDKQTASYEQFWKKQSFIETTLSIRFY